MDGEWFLTNHSKFIALDNVYSRRIAQHEAEALHLADILEALPEWAALREKVQRMKAKRKPLQDVLNLYEAVMAGMKPTDASLLRAYYDERRTLEALGEERCRAKSTILKEKRAAVHTFDTLLRTLCAEFEDGEMP